MIVGISGRKRGGKDTLGAELGRKLDFTRIAFADALKDLVVEIFGLYPPQGPGYRWSDEDWTRIKDEILAYRSSHDALTDESWSGRIALQRVGLAARKVLGEDIWAGIALRKCVGAMKSGQREPPHYAITDMRFPNEYYAVRVAGGVIIRLNRKDSIETWHEFMEYASGGVVVEPPEDRCAYWYPLGVRCGLGRMAHPTSWSDDRHPSETSLPDDSNQWIKYDAVFSGDMEPNTARAVRRVEEWCRGE